MKFETENFTCDTEKYNLDENSFIIKFFDKNKEHSEDEIINYVLVDPGFGYVCLKFKGLDALLSGYLDEKIFTDDIIEKVIDFVEKLAPNSKDAYIPHNIIKVKFSGYVEYNGEF